MLQVGRTFGLRDGMLRLQYELRRGSGLISWRMRSVQGWDSWDLSEIAPGTSATRLLETLRNGSRPFFFSNLHDLRTSITELSGADGEASTLSLAERILSGDLPFFGRLSFHCGFPPQWFRNPTTGQNVSPHQSWTQMRFASPVYGDLKFILEPSRFLFVYALIRAYALTGDQRYPQAFWSAIEDWSHHNPPMAGPLWICGQECSLRILAWSFALHAFANSPATTSDRVALLTSMIAAHAWRTAQTLGYARSQRSNHLISEAVGLLTAGTLYPELREARLWQSIGTHLLHEAVLDQITPEGVSHQHSFNYQRMILHLLVWALRLGEIYGVPLDPDVRERTQAAFEFMHTWVDPISGSVPHYGSDDGSLILPLSSGEYHDFRPLLQLGAAVLDRPALKSGPWDEAALWFGLKPRVLETPDPNPPPSPKSGYFHLGDGTSFAMIRAGRYTRRPFQADQLHVDLWWQGINLARDPGTYLYNGSDPWNNGLAGTAVHNTITIDGCDQMRRAGRFLWIDWAQASGRTYSSRDDARIDRFEGEHHGYARFGVIHRRMVQELAGVGWVIVDDLLGSGEHSACLHWLLPDSSFTDLSCDASNISLQCGLPSAETRIRWSILSSVPGNSMLIRAGKPTWKSSPSETPSPDVQRLGWESPTYGELQPALSLVHQVKSQLPVRFITVVLTDEHCQINSADDASESPRIAILKIDSGRESELYRVNLKPEAEPKTRSATNTPKP